MTLVEARIPGVLLVCHAAGAQIVTTVAGTDFSFPSGRLAVVNAYFPGAVQRRLKPAHK
jgi:hypothetical protein